MKKLLLGLVVLVIILFITNTIIINLVRTRVYERTLTFVDNTAIEVLRELKRADTSSSVNRIIKLDSTQPFLEIEAFDADAMCWSNQFSQYGAAGVLVFDANNDNLLDVYFCQDGQNWTRPTDSKGVLLDKPRFQHNGLYLNQGNDNNDKPIFNQISDLVKNDLYVEEELLIEDYLFPRKSSIDSTDRWGRSSNVAVAADFNNDGLLDVLVGNEPQGMFWSHPKTQRVLMQFVNPVGREAKKSKQPLTAQGLYFIDYTPRHSLKDTRKSNRGIEPEGANSLYLNLGDKDNDGIPEWKDISRETGIEGFRSTYSLSVADIDLDGDLDIFAGNTCDIDYWVGGSKYWAGGANCLYINQLSETGKFEFVEQADEMNVDGVYDEDFPMPFYYKLRRIPFLPPEYSFWFMKFEEYHPEYLQINGQEGEHGQISWSAVLQDVNNDNYPDVWVANDMGYLRLYLNNEGKNFIHSEHARSNRSGYWMTFAPGDLNGDLKEDLFAGNLGGAVMNHAFATPDPHDLFDPVILNSTIFAQFYNDKHDTRHTLIDGSDFNTEIPNQVHHSGILPPDISIPNNYRRHAPSELTLPRFDQNEINSYEFAWGATCFDAQNDGKLDLYYVGCLYGRGGGLFPISGTGPGRFLINTTESENDLQFKDMTAEHHLFNIEELKYDKLENENYIYRKAPRQNWGKRDMVFSYDRSNWALHGPDIQEKITNQDLIQTAENGRAAISADLNNDGFPDIIVRNQGGYDSRSSLSKNLKTMVDDRPKVLPAHNNNYPTPTNYEAGSTRLFLNKYETNNWVKIRLIDNSQNSYNQNAIGAKVIVNGKLLRVKRSGHGGFLSNKFEDLLFGLGKDVVNSVEVQWPDKEHTITSISNVSIKNKTIEISKLNGLLK